MTSARLLWSILWIRGCGLGNVSSSEDRLEGEAGGGSSCGSPTPMGAAEDAPCSTESACAGSGWEESQKSYMEGAGASTTREVATPAAISATRGGITNSSEASGLSCSPWAMRAPTTIQLTLGVKPFGIIFVPLFSALKPRMA